MVDSAIDAAIIDNAKWFVLDQRLTGPGNCLCCRTHQVTNWQRVRGPYSPALEVVVLHNDERFGFTWPYDPEFSRNGLVPFVICDACAELRQMESLL